MVVEGRSRLRCPRERRRPLPIYELALIARRGFMPMRRTRLVKLVAPGGLASGPVRPPASDAVAALLESRGGGGLDLDTSRRVHAGSLAVVPKGGVPASRVVALPGLRGRAPMGIPPRRRRIHSRRPARPRSGASRHLRGGRHHGVLMRAGRDRHQQADAVASAIAAQFSAPVGARHSGRNLRRDIAHRRRHTIHARRV